MSGVKDDGSKAPTYRGVIQLFPKAISAVARVSAFGADKYTWTNWKHVDDGFYRYSDALVRHLGEEGTGKGVDVDSGLLHAIHVAWNSLARLEIILKEVNCDGIEQVQRETTSSTAQAQPYREGPTQYEVWPTSDPRRTQTIDDKYRRAGLSRE